VIVNLLGNAVKFTPSGGSISVAAEPAGNHVTITVRDTGVGMSADDLAIAFEEFARVDPRAEGTGLGLPLARRFVELHGGSLSAASSPGAGSVFTIDLPRQPVSPVEAAPRAAQPARSEETDYTALTRPGSRANRELIAAIATCYLAATAVLFGLLAAVSTQSVQPRLLLVLAAFGWGVAAVAARSWLPLATRGQFEVLAWAGIATVTALVYVADSYTAITALAYGCVIATSFGLWRRRSAVLHLVGVAAAYAAVLAVDTPRGALLQWISVIVMLAFQAQIVSWIAERLRQLVIAEHDAHEIAEQVLAELAAVSKHKSAFLANMSHELRTPLNAIIGFADLLGTELAGPLNERQRDFVTDIQVAARHLLSLITLALDVARLEAGRMPLNLDVVAVRALLERAVDTARSAPERAQPCTVNVSVRPGADFVVGDPHLLQQAVGELVGNALRFSPPDGVVDVIAAPAADDNLEIDVRDSGSGIAEQQSDVIFEPFHQGSALLVPSGPGGTGLGLALVRGVTELHGGRVWFTSARNRGSTFSLILPRLVSDADALSQAVEATA
jgi:signal transduction histidine kinase